MILVLFCLSAFAVLKLEKSNREIICLVSELQVNVPVH